ncbi:LysR family transcriptional regulator [Rhizobium deserti]|nr:LysR family transcriptional regulator [Rhizobium deserti]
MNLSSLLIAQHVLQNGSVRDTARCLDRPVASVSAAMSRLQSWLATPLTSSAGNRILPTLEGRRLARDLSGAADLIIRLARLSPKVEVMGAERHAARMSVSLLTLSRFIIVARTGSIRSAAVQIGMGQPQLTRQLKNLETCLGLTLLQRTATGAVPTLAGQAVLALVEDLEKIWLRISERADDHFRRSASTSNLGSVAPLGRESLIARILARLAAEWPRRQARNPLYISSGSAEELLSGLSNRIYDMVIVDTADLPYGLDHRVISRASLALVGPRHVIDASGTDFGRFLMAAPIALPSLKSGLRQKFSAFSEDVLGADERVRLSYVETDSIPVIANLVLDHGYIALLPQWAISGLDNNMAATILPAAYDMQLSLAWRKGDNSAQLAELVQTILAEAGLLHPAEIAPQVPAPALFRTGAQD